MEYAILTLDPVWNLVTIFPVTFGGNVILYSEQGTVLKYKFIYAKFKDWINSNIYLLKTVNDNFNF